MGFREFFGIPVVVDFSPPYEAGDTAMYRGEEVVVVSRDDEQETPYYAAHLEAVWTVNADGEGRWAFKDDLQRTEQYEETEPERKRWLGLF